MISRATWRLGDPGKITHSYFQVRVSRGRAGTTGRTSKSIEPGQEPNAGEAVVLPAFLEGGSPLPLEIRDLGMNEREEEQDEGRGGNHGS